MIHPRSIGVAVLVLGLAAASEAQGPNLPPGYVATRYFQSSVAANLTGLATDDAGQVYCVYDNGNVGKLTDADGDGVAEIVELVWSGGKSPSVTGIVWYSGDLYMSKLGQITRIRDTNLDGALDLETVIVDGLPTGLHQNNALFADKTRLYFGLGSTSDHDVDPDPRSGTLMTLFPLSAYALVFGRGIRNAFDGAVHPVTRDVFIGDNGPNQVPGLPDPPDEIDRILYGKDYGHPNVWGTDPSGSYADPLALLPPHSSPCGMTFNQNVGLSGYRNELVVATLAGSSSAIYKVPVLYGKGGGIRAWYELFADGFSTAIDVVFDDQGAMYVAEYGSTQTIWRITQESEALLIVETQPSIGSTVDITLEMPGAPNYLSIPAASIGLGPPISLGPGLDVLLDVFSPVFAASISPDKTVFDFAVPTLLDAQGLATVRIHLPDDASLIGAELQLQHLVIDPQTGVPVGVSPPQSLRVLENF